MSPPVDDQPRRRLLLPVVFATVVLILVGASGGMVVRGWADRRAAAERAGPTSAQPGGPSAAASTPGGAPTTAVPTASGAPVTVVDIPLPCQPQTQALAARAGGQGTLYTLAEFTTQESTVWVCTDDRDRLFLHAHRSTDGDYWTEGANTYFAPDPRAAGTGYKGVYRGKDGNHTITVDRTKLRIAHPRSRQQDERVLTVQRRSDVGAQPASGGRPPAPVRVTGKPSSCRPALAKAATAAGASGDLRTALRVRTASWRVEVCVDAAGRPYVQADRSDGGAPRAGFSAEVIAFGKGYRARHTDRQGRTTTLEIEAETLIYWPPRADTIYYESALPG